MDSDVESRRHDTPRSSLTSLPVRATLGLFSAYLLLGMGMAYYHSELHVSGYVAMAFFYCVMFYLGLAARDRDQESLGDMLLAGRSLPFGIAWLTMTATWVGGGWVRQRHGRVRCRFGTRLGTIALGLRA